MQNPEQTTEDYHNVLRLQWYTSAGAPDTLIHTRSLAVVILWNINIMIPILSQSQVQVE